MKKFFKVLTKKISFKFYLIIFFSFKLFIFTNYASAAFSFPGALPSGCSGAGGNYTCGSLTFNDHVNFNDTGNVTITVNGSLTINNYTIGSSSDTANPTFVVNGNVTIAAPTIYANISAGNYNITYNGAASTSGSLTTTSGNISTRGVVYGPITTDTGNITVNANSTSVIWGEITVKNAISTNYLSINQDAVVNGSIYTNSTSTTANLHVDIAERATINGAIVALGKDYTYVNINFDAIVNGDVTAFGNDGATVKLFDRARINGNVKSTSVDNDDGDVDLNANSRITGNTIAFGDINNYGQINGCAQSTYTSGGDIDLRSGSSNSGGSCCGSTRTSCNLSCVKNNSSFSATLCQSAEAIIVNAYGESVNGVWPIMELWVNEVKVDSVVVNSNTAINYTFYANLPATGGFKLDLVFPNDAYNPPEDRNLIINSINYRGKTILSTHSSVIRDWGDNSSQYFDGVNTIGPGQMLYSNGAMRFSTADLIAYYALEEPLWNGSTNETKDTASYTGGPYDGQGIGTPKPTKANVSPALSGTVGTCGYATFSGATNGGSAFTFDNLPISKAANAKTSVTFWIYWNGASDGRILIGWHEYVLGIYGSWIGFNTNGSNDVYGTNIPSGLANGWHHIVAVFNNGGVTSNKIYIDQTLYTLNQKNGSPNNIKAYVQSTMVLGGRTFDQTYRLTGSHADEVKIYNGEITQAQVTADYNATHACTSSNVVASNFNCVATSTNAASGRLYTQLTSTAFNFDIVALNASNAVETSYVTSGTKNVTVEFVDGSGTTACNSRTVLNPTVSQTMAFSASDAGRKSATATISKAYQNVRCRVTDANQSPSVVGCSIDNFSVRPTNFIVTTPSGNGNVNADSTGTSTNSTPVVKAGGNFSLQLAAKKTDGTTDTGYNAQASVNNALITAHSGAVSIGTLTGIFPAALSGISTGTGFTYSEVGYFSLSSNGVYDNTFTSVDQTSDCVLNSYNNTRNGSGLYGCSFGNTDPSDFFGRFIPDHFGVSAGTTTPACGSSFSYYGQDGFTTTFNLTAQNAANTTTKNYWGSFAKLGLTNWSSYNFTAATLPVGSSLSASTVTPTGTWSNGSANVSAKHKVSRPTSTTAPSSVTIFAAPTDSDGVNMPISAVSSMSNFRYGRININNTYGSNLLPLTIPIEAQYWDGTTFRTNTLDSCTSISPNNISMGDYKINLTPCETQISGSSTIDKGKITLNLSKPGVGNNGSVDLTVNLGSVGTNNKTCTTNTESNATATGISWFGTANPAARATFGIIKSPIIYMRENY